MPNWAYGKVEVIAKFDNLVKFFTEELYHPDLKQADWLDISDNQIKAKFDPVLGKDNPVLWFKNLKRSHVQDCDMEVNGFPSKTIDRNKDDDPISVHFTWAEAAWSWDDKKLAELSERTNSEIIVKAEEPNMGFRQFIHVKNGEVLEYREDDLPDDDESEEIYDD